MSDKHQPIEPNRRAFLRTVALGGGAAGVLAGVGVSFAAAPGRGASAPVAEATAPASRGYHLSDHIRQYYRKAAF